MPRLVRMAAASTSTWPVLLWQVCRSATATHWPARYYRTKRKEKDDVRQIWRITRRQQQQQNNNNNKHKRCVRGAQRAQSPRGSHRGSHTPAHRQPAATAGWPPTHRSACSSCRSSDRSWRMPRHRRRSTAASASARRCRSAGSALRKGRAAASVCMRDPSAAASGQFQPQPAKRKKEKKRG